MDKKRYAVIFDLDGTLWDATGCSCEIWNRVFDNHEEVRFRMTQDISAKLMGKRQGLQKYRLFGRSTVLERPLLRIM